MHITYNEAFGQRLRQARVMRGYSLRGLADALGGRVAHDFVPADFWRANLSTMTEKLLPQSESYVWVTMERLDGFITLGYDVVHCLFVEPSRQHRGVGSSLLSHVKRSREKLCLKVYQENTGAKTFYEAHGFVISGETTCPYTGHAEFEMEWEKTPEAPHA